jgi:hypothetical protein
MAAAWNADRRAVADRAKKVRAADYMFASWHLNLGATAILDGTKDFAIDRDVDTAKQIDERTLAIDIDGARPGSFDIRPSAEGSHSCHHRGNQNACAHPTLPAENVDNLDQHTLLAVTKLVHRFLTVQWSAAR